MLKSTFVIILLLTCFLSQAARIDSVSMSTNQPDLLTQNRIVLNFRIYLDNGKVKRTQNYGDYFMFDDVWEWDKVRLSSDQGYIRNGIVEVKREAIQSNDYTLDIYLKIQHKGSWYRDTFRIEFPQLIDYTISTDSLMPYTWNSFAINATFSNGQKFTLKENSNSFLAWTDFEFSSEQQIVVDGNKLYFTPDSNASTDMLHITSTYLPNMSKKQSALPVYKLQQISIYLNGLDGEDGPSADYSNAAWHGGHAEDGANVEIVLRRNERSIDLILYVDSVAEIYSLKPNTKVKLHLQGGDGGDGGNGDYYSSGGDGGDGGNGGTVVIISDFDIKYLSEMFTIDVSGGTAGIGGKTKRPSYLNHGKKGKEGLDGEIHYLILGRKAMNQLFTDYGLK